MGFLTLQELISKEFQLPLNGKTIEEIFAFDSEFGEQIVETKSSILKPKFKQHVLLAARSQQELNVAFVECLKSFCMLLQNSLGHLSPYSKDLLIRFKEHSDGKAIKVTICKRRVIYSVEYNIIVDSTGITNEKKKSFYETIFERR